MNILNTNEETGKANYHYTENRYNHDTSAQKFDYSSYNQKELAKAKQIGGILNTNAESGYETWDWNKKQKMPAPPKDYFEQYSQGKKKPGAILKSNAENGAWNFASREYYDPETIKRFNMKLQNNNLNNDNYDEGIYSNNNNDNYNVNNNNNGPINSFSQIPQDVIDRADRESQIYSNLTKGNQENSLNKGRVDVEKIETNESIIVENGVKKKVTKVVKYMSDGEVKTEIYKTNV
jgi:hypothetical protein